MICHHAYLDFLFETGLSQAQFILLYLVYKKDKDYIDKYKNRFPTEDGTMIGKYLTDNLIKDGWLSVGYQGKLVVTNKFCKYFVKDAEALEELLEAYPPFIDIGGVKTPLVAVDKYEYELVYSGRINNSYEEHKEVLKDLKFGLDNGYIRFKVAKFIDGEMWKPLRKLRKGEAAQLDFDIHRDF